MNTDVMDSKQNQEESGSPGSITPGLLFPDYDSMTAFLDQWSRDKFSPLTKRSSGGISPGRPRPHHTFCCPHKKVKRTPKDKEKQRARKIKIEYVDCPFLIDTKVNPDGSCVVTRAWTEHSGHQVSEEQFQKYKRARMLTREQEDAVLSVLTKVI